MPRRGAALAALAAMAMATARGAQVSPVQKVVMLLTNLEGKIVKDGQEEEKAFEAFMDWCRTGAKDKQYEIKDAKRSIEDLNAAVQKANSDSATHSSRIEETTASVSENEADLKAAVGIRQKEHKEFVANERELVDTVDTLERAINVLERKLRGSALLQEKLDRRNVGVLIKTLSTIVDAAALSLHDKQRLVGLVQNNDNEEDDELDEENGLGAPAAQAYTSHSESIIDVLEDLLGKAKHQLEEARREEANSRHNFELLKQSLEDQIAVDTKELSEAKTAIHEAQESKATAEGELEVTKKDLADAQLVLKNMDSDCQTKSADHDLSVKNRAEELQALAAAKKALTESSAGASEVAYGFIQTGASSPSFSQLQTRADLMNFEVVNIVRKLAKEHGSKELQQLALRINTVLRQGGDAADDPFAKVKAMISDMIERLEKEAGTDAQHKAYCDKEMGDTNQKLDELKYDIEKYSSKIDKARSEAARLKNEVSTAQKELMDLTKSQAEADKLRTEEHAVYTKSKADLEEGLRGVRLALKILREYYAKGDSLTQTGSRQPDAPEFHSKASSSSSGIIGMLEVIESDFGKNLASVEMNEEVAATSYQRLSMENKVSRSMLEKDVKYKTKAGSALDKSASEFSSDRDSAQTELDAVLQYSANIRGACEVKPEGYQERKARREAEIAGLREALEILRGEAVLLQHQRRRAQRASFLARRR